MFNVFNVPLIYIFIDYYSDRIGGSERLCESDCVCVLVGDTKLHIVSANKWPQASGERVGVVGENVKSEF